MHVSENGPKLEPDGQIRCVFFDAAGTLIHPIESVGETYARIGADFGFLAAGAETLDKAFRQAFRVTNPPAPEQDDRHWWRELVEATFQQAGVAGASGSDFDSCFDSLFDHYAKGEAWRIYPEVEEVLRDLSSRKLDLWVLSNFDARLVPILDDLGLSGFFRGLVYSSEVGFSKPAPEIFAEAVRRCGYPPESCLHVGDDPDADWGGGAAAGLSVFRLDRKVGDLSALLSEGREKTF